MGAKLQCHVLFGDNGWHTLTTMSRKDGQRLCYWCGAPETQKALVNVWGNVHEAGACGGCFTKHHGKRSDSL